MWKIRFFIKFKKYTISENQVNGHTGSTFSYFCENFLIAPFADPDGYYMFDKNYK